MDFLSGLSGLGGAGGFSGSSSSSASSGSEGSSSLSERSDRSQTSTLDLSFNVAGRGSNLNANKQTDDIVKTVLLFGIGAVVVMAAIKKFK